MQLSVVLMPLLSVAQAYSYDPESSEVIDTMPNSPINCYVNNVTTGSVTLEICGKPEAKTRFVPKPQPACMMVRTRKGKTVRSCVVLHAVAAAACDATRCLANEKPFFSSCCCLSTGCNEKMMLRPQQ